MANDDDTKTAAARRNRLQELRKKRQAERKAGPAGGGRGAGGGGRGARGAGARRKAAGAGQSAQGGRLLKVLAKRRQQRDDEPESDANLENFPRLKKIIEQRRGQGGSGPPSLDENASAEEVNAYIEQLESRLERLNSAQERIQAELEHARELQPGDGSAAGSRGKKKATASRSKD